MTQAEIYELAGQLTDKQVAYLVCSYMEHIKTSEFGFRIKAGEVIYNGIVEAHSK